MSEISNIFKDIRSGALPVSEIPGFLAWLFRKVAWLCIALVSIAGIILLVILT